MLVKLLKDKSGNFGMLTALLALPLIGVAGMAVDYTRALSQRNHMQDAADAAVLAAAASGKTGAANLSRVAETFFNGNMAQHGYAAHVTNVSVDATGQISLSARADVPVSFAVVLNPAGIPVSVVSKAQPGQDRKIEVVLVLDNTYSMVGKKLADLQAASKSMLDVFQKSDKTGSRIRIAIVPFSRYVNVGLQNRDQSWLTVPADYATTTDSCSTSRPVISQSGCTTTTKTGYNDGIPYTYTQKQCTSTVYGDPVTTCGPHTSTYKWSGCVDSRKSPYDVNDGYNPKYSGLLNTSCGSAITPLTNDYVALRAAVDTMKANNETYIAPGILWGWNVLSPELPYIEGQPTGPSTKKIMVVMTDGANTKSPSYPYHNGSDTKKADKQMRSVCDNARNAGISTYTVAVGVDDSAALAALADCAEDKSKALSINDTNQLTAIFDGIATQILTARLTM